MSWYYGFKPYVSAAERRAKAQREMAKLAKKGKVIQPIVLEGKKIATTFWGSSWCTNLESYMDFENRLPRGRTYVRNGSVVHLDIRPGEIEAIVSGSELYNVKISIAPAAKAKWKSLCTECSGGIGSLVELLQGRFSDHVMSILSRKGTGLFPAPSEIKMKCSCPDWATMCKHVAAVLYGVGARLDTQPELLFLLRSVKHEDLITQATTGAVLAGKAGAAGLELAESELSSVFGIELDTEAPAPAAVSSVPAPVAKPPSALPNPPAPKPARRKNPRVDRRPILIQPKAKASPPRTKAKSAKKLRRTMSDAARKLITEAAKARWAKAQAKGAKLLG